MQNITTINSLNDFMRIVNEAKSRTSANVQRSTAPRKAAQSSALEQAVVSRGIPGMQKTAATYAPKAPIQDQIILGGHFDAYA
jgi:hypothetical protein